MIEATAEVRIARPGEDVFDYLADARNEPKWLPGASGVTKETDGPVAQGTRFRGRYARIGEVEIELVEHERPSGVTFGGRSSSVDFDDAVTLSPDGDGTLLSARMTSQPKGLMRLLAPLAGRVMQKQFAANWLHLRDTLESR